MKEEHMKEELVTYSTAVFYVDSGYYSIANLEDMIKNFKTQKALQDKALLKSMEVEHDTR